MIENGELHTIDPLFDFQTLCDTDLGLYFLIKRDYYDKSVFSEDLFDSNDIRFIKTMLMCRDHFNPLFLFCKKNVMSDEELDDLYQQFLDKEYNNILELSPPTAILELACVSNSVKNIINPIIICKNEKEIEWINKYDSRLNCIIADLEGFDISEYDTIYIKDIYNILILKQESVHLKNIFISKYAFNLEVATSKIELPLVKVVEDYYIRNKILLIDPYKDLVIPESEMV